MGDAARQVVMRGAVEHAVRLLAPAGPGSAPSLAAFKGSRLPFWKELGWLTGLEPASPWTTTRSSTDWAIATMCLRQATREEYRVPERECNLVFPPPVVRFSPFPLR